MPRVPSQPRLCAKQFFLTYAQIEGFTKEDLADFLSHTSPEFHWCEVAQETHADGGIHYHAVVTYNRPYQRGLDSFDTHGHHPNIVVIRPGRKQLYNRRRYIRKEDDDVVSRGQAPPYSEEAERRTWGDILNSSATKEDFLAGVRENYPREFCLQWDRLNTFANEHFNSPSDYVCPWPEEQWVVPPEIDEWMADVFRQVCNRSGSCSPLRCAPLRHASYGPSPDRAF